MAIPAERQAQTRCPFTTLATEEVILGWVRGQVTSSTETGADPSRDFSAELSGAESTRSVRRSYGVGVAVL